MNVERKLVDALASGNALKIERIFKEIYDSNYKLVYFCCANFIKNKEDIEEIVNDVFINFYNHLNNISVDGNIKYYLTRSAHNACVNYMKRKDNKEIIIDSIYLENKTYVEMKYIDNDLFNDVKNILDEDEYDILFKHIVLGYSLKDISLIRNVSSNTLKSKYRRSLIKLKKNLGGKYYE